MITNKPEYLRVFRCLVHAILKSMHAFGGYALESAVKSNLKSLAIKLIFLCAYYHLLGQISFFFKATEASSFLEAKRALKKPQKLRIFQSSKLKFYC